MLSLGNKATKHRLLRLLHLIFLDKLKAADKAAILKQDYDLILTPVMEGELMKMGSLAEGIAERARIEGRAEGIAEGKAAGIAEGKAAGIAEGKAVGIETTILMTIRNLMKTMNLTAKQAMDAMKIPASEQKKYAAQV